MKIDRWNAEVINTKEVYIHDDILNLLQFDKINKKLHLEISKECSHDDIYEINFFNVIGFEITSCDFWGASYHILDFEYVKQDDEQIISKICMQWKDRSQLITEFPNQDYFETLLTFSSGDELRIACNLIVFEK